MFAGLAVACILMAPLTGHGTITGVAEHKTGQMRHKPAYSESVSF